MMKITYDNNKGMSSFIRFLKQTMKVITFILICFHYFFNNNNSYHGVNSFSFYYSHPSRKHSLTSNNICNTNNKHVIYSHLTVMNTNRKHPYLQSYTPQRHQSHHRLLNRAEDGNDNQNDRHVPPSSSRRSFLSSSLCVPSSMLLWNTGFGIDKGIGSIRPQSAYAAGKPGLVQFPCSNGLGNTYYFMRAGQSLLEADDIWTTNPLLLTNRETALSEIGISQIEETCQLFEQKGITITLVKYSLAASCIDSANIVGKKLQIGRDRLVPEFTFMDPRAVGMWDMSPMSVTEPAVWALDAEEAGSNGTGGKPPPHEDGTPNETLSTQIIRLRQLMSVLETQYSGDNILLIFPDGTTPAVLTAAIGGMPLNRVHELNFKPGEVHFNVTYESARLRMPSPDNPDVLQSTDEIYLEKIKRGRNELQILRDNPDAVINVKDLEFQKTLRDEEEKAAILQEAKAIARAKAENIKAEKLEADRLSRETQLKVMRESREKEKELNAIRASREKEKKTSAVAAEKKISGVTARVPQENDSDNNSVATGILAIGSIGAIAAASVMNESSFEEISSQEGIRNNSILTSSKGVEQIGDQAKINDEVKNIVINKTKTSIDAEHADLYTSPILTSNTAENKSDKENGEKVRSLLNMKSNSAHLFKDNAIGEKHITSIGELHHDNKSDFDFTSKKNGEKVKPLLDMKSNPAHLFNDISIGKNHITGTGGIYEDNTSDFDDPEKKAAKAMEDYINQDDGGDAWLQMLSGMAQNEINVEMLKKQ